MASKIEAKKEQKNKEVELGRECGNEQRCSEAQLIDMYDP
jgi:hypothetical protein